jgi:hypothetical protein
MRVKITVTNERGEIFERRSISLPPGGGVVGPLCSGGDPPRTVRSISGSHGEHS